MKRVILKLVLDTYSDFRMEDETGWMVPVLCRSEVEFFFPETKLSSWIRVVLEGDHWKGSRQRVGWYCFQNQDGFVVLNHERVKKSLRFDYTKYSRITFIRFNEILRKIAPQGKNFWIKIEPILPKVRVVGKKKEMKDE